MKTLKQLLRQPLKTLSGVLLMTLAAAVLCLCAGQAMAVQATEKQLEQQFSTIAIPKGGPAINSAVTATYTPILTEEFLSWLDRTAEEHPEVVKQVARQGILSAYIPELTPLNITQEQYVPMATKENFSYYAYQPHTNALYSGTSSATGNALPYTCAMLVITLESVGEPEERVSANLVEKLTVGDFPSLDAYYNWYQTAEKVTATMGYTVELSGTITEVLSLQEGYRDPVGRTARLIFTAPTLEAIEALALDLEPGRQYVVYGMDYVDEYWKLVGSLNLDGRYDHIQFEPYDPSALDVLTEQELEKYQQRYLSTKDTFWRDTRAFYHGIALDENELRQINAISMTLALPVPLTQYQAVRDEEGILLELLPETAVSYMDLNGETVTVSAEEYDALYRIPTIAPLEGTVEEFLASPEGEAWQAALERDAVNNQAFAVIGVEDLDYLADFSLGNTKITTGRGFSQEELAAGSRVCVLHEELAVANGLEVGDTVTLSFYHDDPGLPYQWHRSENNGILNPSATLYFDTTPILETAEYTVVGICRSELTWADVAENPYSFSTNTVYVPLSSVETSMETCSSLPFVTAVLHNGTTEQFQELAKDSGYAGRFRYSDQGYSVIAGNFHDYEALARQVLWVGVAVYAVLLALFLLLYPASLKKNVGTMESLGAGGGRRFGHVLASSVAILLPASLLGGLLGALLWDRVVAALQASVEASVVLQGKPWALAAVCAAQFAAALLLNVFAALPAAASRGMSKRR